MRILILAAGLGKRMKSKYPKVMHKIMGKELVNWVIDTAGKLNPTKIGVVLGHKSEMIQNILPEDVEIYYQKEQLGTGHAVMSAKDFINDENILILYGDTPLITANTLNKLIEKHNSTDADATILTAILDNPTGYGRILKDIKGNFIDIIEEADTDETQKKIKEINSGFVIYKGKKLIDGLAKIKPNNNQGEYYLTDVAKHLNYVETYILEDFSEALGINNRIQLAEAEKIMKKRTLTNLMLDGVTIIDPDTTYISPDVKIGQDTVIYPMTFIYGKTEIGEECEIGPMTRIENCKIGNFVKIFRSECEEAIIENNVSVGPYSRLRTGTVLKENVKIGNFVETKKTTVSKNTKAQHLTYLGDAFIGEDTNIGAGTITCNYDGKNKHKTYIGNNVFVGSNTALVAPIKIENNALIGAGSTITENIPEGALALGRARQINKENWVFKKREKGE
ncbi:MULTISPECIES: bifunctional UDP-N-acetylglucosamine diphosphorylase/glucosamine-1-phosphate N-acetyltransferase GlmU [unclassified Marinitoga]|uniref:bifunctional UDP-N-acetylglucosamine diphosphorylase/glucosamine-1-phosphate N-acetyltransferase GlmU n=1 Tax=unclassified Marinitoga TaxID=2640159 RepID=UPI000640ED62|nr:MULTISPECIES: bifunctional UDP-N-acetylglucosamine diphosphorylase/glucosamine-1-phosphate N-acetyltransferase GlmU [unclassified Marinitoga]KLO20860.1 N-acetylglucosamine-1-phosphate uridyltransferase [Marinitoga sp. 1155]NUU99227.1 bifunctional N-acetylglucosamine-1-phosphate uridyltransferase/glucosamine-1-phosphate acetyltransferase [Marinitoga sp. 1154]